MKDSRQLLLFFLLHGYDFCGGGGDLVIGGGALVVGGGSFCSDLGGRLNW